MACWGSKKIPKVWPKNILNPDFYLFLIGYIKPNFIKHNNLNSSYIFLLKIINEATYLVRVKL